MVTHLQRSLLLLITLLSHITPPVEPPGNGAMATPQTRTVPCPNPNCAGRGRWQGGLVYWCRACRETFNYCTACKSDFPDGEEDKHSHPAA